MKRGMCVKSKTNKISTHDHTFRVGMFRFLTESFSTESVSIRVHLIAIIYTNR